MFQGKIQCARRLGPQGCAPCTEVGLLLKTPVRTKRGYIPAAELVQGDELALFPHGFAAPALVHSRATFVTPVGCPLGTLPVHIPALSLGIHGDIVLQHDTRVLFMDPDFRPVLNTPWVTIAAGDLIGFRGITLVKPEPMRLVIVKFDSDQIITIDDGFRILVPADVVPLDQPADLYGDATHPVVHLSAEQADCYLASLECDIAAGGPTA